MKQKRKKYAPRKRAKKKTSLSYSKGKGSILILLGIIILGSILLTGGIFPKQNINPPEYNTGGILVSQTPGPGYKNLQLDTLKFKQCETDAAVDFLIDVSLSMESENKMSDLKNALKIFGAVFPGSGILAMQIFTSPESPYGLPPTGYRELIPFSYYQEVRSRYQSIVSSLSGHSGTHTKDAFVFAKSKIEAALADPRFENKKFNLIFISDGVPETGIRNTNGEDNKECTPSGTDSEFCTASPLQKRGDPRFANACRCFDTAQDSTSVANEIKQLKNKNGDPVKIYSIGYVSSEDRHFKDKLGTLMKNVASFDDNPPCPQDDPDGDFCDAPIGEKIKDILVGKIIKRICSDE